MDNEEVMWSHPAEVMWLDMWVRVGQFQVCVSDFFHLLNFRVCYKEKNEKIF